MAGLNNKIISGVFWSSIQVIINRSFSFIIKLILARLLFPEDFGLVGMAAVFISFINVFNDLGMGSALIQRKKEELTDDHFHTSFWTGVGWSLLIFTVVGFLVGPLAAWFYEEELLKLIVPALSLSILVSPINMVQQAQLTRDLKFKKLAFIGNLSTGLAAIISLVLAFYGAGVWALVANSVGTNIFALPLFIRATSYKPKFIWNKECFKDIFGFGAYTTATSLFGKITSNIDYLIVGKFLGASALGIYTFAFIFTDVLRSQLMTIVKSVMFPVFSQLQNEPEKLKGYYLKVVEINGLLVNPVMFGIMLFAGTLIPLFFGNKWDNSIEIIQILSVGVIIHMINNSNSALFKAKGKVRIDLYMHIFKTMVFFVPAIIIGTYYYGMIGTAYGFLIAKILDVSFTLLMTQKILNISAISVLAIAYKPLIISLIPSALVKALMFLNLNVILLIIIFVIGVLLLNYVFEKNNVLFLVKKFKERKTAK